MVTTKIRISKLFENTDAKVIHDVEVVGFGMLLNRTPGVVAPLGSMRFVEHFLRNAAQIRALVTTQEIYDFLLQNHSEVCSGLGIVLHGQPLDVFFETHHDCALSPEFSDSKPSSIDPSAIIASTAVIADRNVIIAEDVVIEDFVVIREDVTVGKGTVIRAGSVIGGDGFEYRSIRGTKKLVPHTGGVVIGERVDVHYNTCIDRGLLTDDTEIGDESRLDNMVHIAHAAKLGKRCSIVTGVVVCGACVLGDDVWMGPNAVISNSLSAGDRARISLGAVAVRDVPEDTTVSGNFAVEHKQFRKIQSELKKQTR